MKMNLKILEAPSSIWRFRPVRYLIALFAICTFLLYYSRSDNAKTLSSAQGKSAEAVQPARLPCASLPGAEDVLLILKTGATELKRLPLHLQTTLRCAPHYVIYSDVEQDVFGHHVYDALKTIPYRVQQTHDDFQFYLRLQDYNREGRDFEKLLAEDTEDDRKGWHLDKWKFLPIIERALEFKPDAKWYFLIETDTYLVWSNLLTWLSKMDPSKPFYGGSASSINGITFGHGGSGYVISAPLMKMAADLLATDRKKFYYQADSECCGDFVLGKFLLENFDIGLHNAWPVIQGETPASSDYIKEILCHPVISYHHMTPDEQLFMWNYEQKWLETETTTPISHLVVFKSIVWPLMQNSDVVGWDNRCLDRNFKAESVTDDMTREEKVAHTSIEACRAACQMDLKCVQYSYQPGPVECRFGYIVQLGKRAAGTTSGWLTLRIGKFLRKIEPECEYGWKLPKDED